MAAADWAGSMYANADAIHHYQRVLDALEHSVRREPLHQGAAGVRAVLVHQQQGDVVHVEVGGEAQGQQGEQIGDPHRDAAR